MKHIKITLLLAIAASSTLHGFIPGDAASAGASNGTPSLPPCMAIEQGSQCHRLMQLNQSTQEALTNSDCTTSAELSAGQEPEQPQELTAKKKFVCPDSKCGYDTNRKWCFDNHIRTHAGYKPFICYLCGRHFVEKNNRDRHEKAHSSKKPFKCPYCSKSTTRDTNLMKHIERMHPKIINLQQDPAASTSANTENTDAHRERDYRARSQLPNPVHRRERSPEPRQDGVFDLMQGPRAETPPLVAETGCPILPSSLQEPLNPEGYDQSDTQTNAFLNEEYQNNGETV